MSDCAFQSNGESGGGDVPPLFQQDDIVASFDLAAQTARDFNATPGAVVLTSEQGPTLSFNAIRQTVFAGSTFDLDPGTGVRFRANATSTVFTSNPATRTAAALSFRALDFWNAFGVDGRRDYFVSVYCSALTLPTAQVSPTGFLWGLIGRVNIPGGSSDRLVAIRRHNAAGVQALGTMRDTAANGNYTNPLPTADTKVLGFQWAGAMDCFAGDWDTSGGQAWEDVAFVREVASLILTTTGGAQFKDQGNDIVMAFPTGNTNADMAVDVERIVIRSPL